MSFVSIKLFVLPFHPSGQRPLTLFQTLYVGISAVFADDHTAVVALAIHDTVYLVDFSVRRIELDAAIRTGDDLIAEHILDDIRKYEHDNFAKFIGAGLPATLKYMSLSLCSRLWLDLDIIPIVIRPDDEGKEKNFWDAKRVDEQADSMARKCILNFSPSLVPILQVGWRGVVQTDAGFRAQLTTVQDYKDSCGSATWNAMMVFAKQLRNEKTKIAFFSSTPQGGGVALMRHALVRFARLLGIDLTWYGKYRSAYCWPFFFLFFPLSVHARNLTTEQFRSRALVCSASRRTCTTSFKESAIPTSASRPKRSRPLSIGSPRTQTATGFPKVALFVLPKRVAPMLSWWVDSLALSQRA